MKTTCYVIMFVIALLLQGMAWGSESVSSISDAYVFPIRPGMEKWKEFETHAEMSNATQIPETVLHNMSTEGLIETCLDYPLLMDFTMYNSLQQGFWVLEAQFNGLQELLRRENSAAKLIEKYHNMAPEHALDQKKSSTEQSFIFQLAFVEFILSQEEITSKLSSNDLRNMVKDALGKYKTKLKYPDYYGAVGISSSGFVMKRAMKNSKYSAQKETGFESELDVLPNINQILSDAERFITE